LDQFRQRKEKFADIARAKLEAIWMKLPPDRHASSLGPNPASDVSFQGEPKWKESVDGERLAVMASGCSLVGDHPACPIHQYRLSSGRAASAQMGEAGVAAQALTFLSLAGQ